MMKRREFITLLSGAAAWPLAASAPGSRQAADIGFLGSITRQLGTHGPPHLSSGCGELGWIEGRTIAIEYRWAEGRSERFAGIAAEFVRLKVDVIVTAGPQPRGKRKQRRRFQFVFALSTDPVGSGFVNVLSATRRQPYRPIAPANRRRRQRVELLREVSPAPPTGIMVNVGSPGAVWRPKLFRRGTHARTGDRQPRNPTSGGYRCRFRGRSRPRGGSLCCCGRSSPRTGFKLIRCRSRARLPTIYHAKEHVEAGGPDVLWPEFSGPIPARGRLCRQILRGTKPATSGRAADQFDLVIN